MNRQAYLPLATYPDPNSPAIAANAVRVAAHLGYEIHAMALIADIRDVSNHFSRVLTNVADLIRQAEDVSATRGEDLLNKTEEEARKAGVPYFRGAKEFNAPLLADFAASRARYFDCTICGWESNRETSRLLTETIIFGSGRPVVVIPELCSVGELNHVAIAWDGSRAAARALADANPFLTRARKVSIITVQNEKALEEEDPGGRLASVLHERGLNCTAVSIDCNDCTIETALQERALALGAQVLVMGAFGHSRFREFILGGATRGVLSNLLMPVLLSH